MGWSRILGSSLPPAPLPCAVIRHLLLDHQIGLGSRVLDVGCGQGELVHLLDDLGIEAAGADESPENIKLAKQHEPRSDFDLVTEPIEKSLESVGHGEPLDLIVLRHLTTYDGNLFCPNAFQATARLLQQLRPNGWITFLVHRDDNRRESGTSHDVACFARHLSFFPGTCKVSHFADCDLMTIASDWLHGHRHRGEFLATSLRVPDSNISSAEWQRHAIQASACHDGVCCKWASQFDQKQAA